jgi:hypothetical protein
MTSLADLNQFYRQFYEDQRVRVDAHLAKPDVAKIVAKREAKKARFVELSVNEPQRVERLRNQLTFEGEVETVAEEYACLKRNAFSLVHILSF